MMLLSDSHSVPCRKYASCSQMYVCGMDVCACDHVWGGEEQNQTPGAFPYRCPHCVCTEGSLHSPWSSLIGLTVCPVSPWNPPVLPFPIKLEGDRSTYHAQLLQGHWGSQIKSSCLHSRCFATERSPRPASISASRGL